MAQNKSSFMKQWIAKKRRQRSKRALVRQLDYQEKKSEALHDREKQTTLDIFVRAQAIRRRLEQIHPITDEARVLEVGSGAHGLIFGFGSRYGFGIDPLAVDYKRLFPVWQQNAKTASAIGEELPFADGAFDVVLSDNVIDHAEKPEKIVEELARVLKPGGLLYFTVNIHHPIYDLASKAHGAWNALGIGFELSPFADHTVHFTENQIKKVVARLPLRVIEENSTVEQTKTAYRQTKSSNVEQQLKKLFFKNALYELIAAHN
jgi:SAM-dependent methyltransferase